LFFERFREAVARLPDGLIRPSAPATPEAIEQAARRLGRALPPDYASFLRSFDGADLFHETVVLAGAGPTAPLGVLALNGLDEAPSSSDDPSTPIPLGPFVFAEAVVGDRFALDDDGRVLRLRAGSDERILAGSSFERWLDATVARERVLYGSDGEFADDIFDDDGEEIAPIVVLKQAERALKVDAGSAEAHHDRGVALRRLGRTKLAIEAFSAATALDPGNPWPWFDLGRTALDAGLELPRAHEAFTRAAAAESGPAGGRLLAWAARAALAAGDEPAATRARGEALARDPALGEAFARAEAQATLDGDEESRAENEALRLSLAPTSTPRRSLRVVDAADETLETAVTELPSRRSPSARPPRPAPATKPRGGASPRGSRPRR
jgi:tetratricopeptide (TPR) repeat protein